MKAEVKKKWIEALRSRRFKQGNTYLKQTYDSKVDRLCCLGVLHEIDGGKWTEVLCRHGYTRHKTGAGKALNSSAQKLNGPFARGLTIEETDRLIDMNDNKGYKFYQIANWIEKNIKTKD